MVPVQFICIEGWQPLDRVWPLHEDAPCGEVFTVVQQAALRWVVLPLPQLRLQQQGQGWCCCEWVPFVGT